MTIAERYAKVAALWPANLLAELGNVTPDVVWVEETLVGYGDVVVDVITGSRRPVTDADGVPLWVPPPLTVCEGEPPSGLITSPDGTWSLGQVDGNLIIVIDGVTTFVTDDGSPLDGYGIYYGNWRAGHVARSRHDGDLPPFEVHWAHDSSRVIVPRVDLRHVEPYPFLETAPLDGTFRPIVHAPRFPLTGEEPAGLSWYCFDRFGASVRLDLPTDLLFLHQDLTPLHSVRFSSDGTHAYVVAYGSGMRSAYLLDVDLETGSARTILSESRHPRMQLNTSTYRPANVCVLGDLERVVWFSQRDGWGHLYLYDGRGQLLNQITSGDWTVRDLLRCDDDWLYFTGAGRDLANPYLRSLYRVRYDGTDLTLLSPEDADCELDPVAGVLIGSKGGTGDFLSPRGDFVVYRCSTVATPPQLVVRSTVDGSLVRVLETARPPTGYSPPREVITKAADGSTDLYGLLYLPPDFDPDATYPVIVYQYASPLLAATPRTYVDAITGGPGIGGAAAYAALGTVCLTLDARGTTGRSAAFSDHGYGALNLIGLDDYVAAIGQLGEQHAFVDATRVAIVGGSYGGYTVLRAVLEYPEVFRVGLCDAPMAMPPLMYPDYHWEAYQGEPSYDGSPKRPHDRAVPGNYEPLNASAQVDRIRGHLLITVGELDENCPPGNVMPFIRAAYDLDKDVDLLFVPGSSHQTFGRTRYVIRRHLDYLVQHLLSLNPPPHPDLAAIPQAPEPAIRKTPSPW